MRKKKDAEPAAEAAEAALNELPAEAPAGPTAATVEAAINTPPPAAPDAGPRPPMNSPEWTPWLAKQLRPDEVFDGCPKTDGLRRLVQEHLGDILENVSRVVFYDGRSACVEHHIVVASHADHQVRRYTGVADVGPLNMEQEYARFPSASAQTRAKGRAYREALQMAGPAAEEMTAMPVEAHAGFVSDSQLTTLDAMAERCDIDVMAFIKAHKAKHKIRDSWGAVGRIPHGEAEKLVGAMSEVQRSGTTPDAVKGYKPEWRNQ
jgi:hypothetical protein